MSFCFLRTMKTVSPSSGTLETTNIQVQKPLTRSRSMKLFKSLELSFLYLNIYLPWNTKGVVNAVSWEGENKLWQSSGCSKNAEYGQKEIPHNQRCPQLERFPLGHEVLAPEDHQEVDTTGPPTPLLSRIIHTRTFSKAQYIWGSVNISLFVTTLTYTPAASCPPSTPGPLSAQIPGQATFINLSDIYIIS